MAWTVANLLVGGGTLRKGTRVDRLMRDLLGREPGTVPGETPPEPETLTAEASIAHMAAWVRSTIGKATRRA